jgi:putative addiction module killer protein
MNEIFTIEYYETDTGKCPYLEWESELSIELRAQIRKRLNRVRMGSFGDIDHIDGSIFELRIHSGAGYRIYYAKKDNKIVILLCAGSKRSQDRDIVKAKKYWQDLGG